MADWANNYKMHRMGVFSTPSYAGVGEPYVDTMKGAARPGIKPEASVANFFGSLARFVPGLTLVHWRLPR